MANHSFRFPKAEKLCGLTTVNQVFAEGNRIKISPLKCVWIKSENCNISRIMFSVPKKFFKHAVDRNQIKRYLRESYRLNNSGLKAICLQQNVSLNIAVVYSSSEMLDFEETQKRMIALLSKLQSAIEDNDKLC